jgi:hypothetical protein
LRINVGGEEHINAEVADLEKIWRTSLAESLRAEVLAAAAE